MLWVVSGYIQCITNSGLLKLECFERYICRHCARHSYGKRVYELTNYGGAFEYVIGHNSRAWIVDVNCCCRAFSVVG